jgi:hypothetical protein
MDDERVLITVVGDRPQTLHVSHSEAKRFAWSMLADLDGEGAADAGYVVIHEPRAVNVAEGDRAAWGSQIEAIMAYLAGGQADTASISANIGTSRQQTAVQLCRLRSRGMVLCTRRGIAGIPALWTLGHVSIDAWKAARITKAMAA